MRASLLLICGLPALAGAAWAGTAVVATAAGGPAAVKVRCTATTRRGKRVRCSIVRGAGDTAGPRGPAGPRGADGKAGPQGAAGPPGSPGTAANGPTVLTQPPAWSALSGLGAPALPDGTEIEHWNVDNNSTSQGAPATGTVETELLSPSELSGSATSLASVTFCYGVAVSRATTGTTSISIAHATVFERDEPAASTTGPSDWQAPPYTTDTLIDTALDLSGQSGCATLTPSAAAPIDPSGYLAIDLTVDYQLGPATGGTSSQVTLQLGRVTTTYA
jgi:hypothetical protein